MTAQHLLDTLQAQGVELWAEGDKLRFSAPRGALTDALRAQLAGRKEDILNLLREGRNVSLPKPDGVALEADTRHQGPGSSIHAELYRRRFRAGSDKAALLDACPPYIRYVNPCLGYMLQQINMDKEFVRGEGTCLYDRSGARYLDFIAQYGALPFGHNPEAIWDALEQVRRDKAPGFVNLSVLGAAGALAERLLQIAPPGIRYVTFANSGAEAVEAAIKLCRSTTRRPGILSALNSFHGKTLGALSATGKRMYQAAFNAPAQDFCYVPFGDASALDRALRARPKYFAAFIVEPIQGEGGVCEAPSGYLAQAAALCQSHGVLFVADEVQTGLGRTGTMFACEHEGVSPDVMTLAKALGGGIMPIGACLYKEDVLNEEFATQHTSTFAGNSVACRAGLAALDLLTRDDGALLRNVRKVGAHLKDGLERLRGKHPRLVNSIRGRGLLLGLQFNLSSDLFTRGLLRYMADQEIFTYTLAAHLLNVHHVRVAPTLSAPDVLRIEPPLTVSESECDVLLAALDETLDPLQHGNVAPIIAHMVGADLRGRPQPAPTDPSSQPPAADVPQPLPAASSAEGRFGFVTHIGDEDTWTTLDPSLQIFTEEEMTALKRRVIDLLDPVAVAEVLIRSRTGQVARGEFVMLPFSAREMIEMPYERAVAEVRYAVQLCAKRGAKIVGLGGFNSIVTQGGLTIAGECGVALTTGNSYTALAGLKALELACHGRGLAMADCAAGVVGATGALGKASAMLLAERVSRLILVGNPLHEERSMVRLHDVVTAVVRHLWRELQGGRQFEEKTLGHRLAAILAALSHEVREEDCKRIAQDFVNYHRCVVLGVDSRSLVRDADLVITATSSVERLFDESSFKENAIVCELSRPFNVGEDIRKARPDVTVLEGGLTRIPGEPDLALRNGLPKGITFACVAETMMLAMEKTYEDTSLGVDLDLDTIRRLDALSYKHGFDIVI